MEILYEDNHIIVVNKPQGVGSQPDKTGDKDLLTMVKEYIKEKYNKPGEAFVGLVHRLDRPTGGAMVFAKTSKAASRLSEQMRAGDFDKTYYAVVEGKVLNERLIKLENPSHNKWEPKRFDPATSQKLLNTMYDLIKNKLNEAKISYDNNNILDIILMYYLKFQVDRHQLILKL